MSWITPKTTWGTDGVGNTDFERMEGNIAVLHAGNGQAALETVVAASSLTLPNETDETFIISASPDPGQTIGYISTTNRQPGNRIQLICSGISYDLGFAPGGASPPPGFAPIRTKTGLSYTAAQNDVVTLIYDGEYWYVDK